MIAQEVHARQGTVLRDAQVVEFAQQHLVTTEGVLVHRCDALALQVLQMPQIVPVRPGEHHRAETAAALAGAQPGVQGGQGACAVGGFQQGIEPRVGQHQVHVTPGHHLLQPVEIQGLQFHPVIRQRLVQIAGRGRPA